jgi:SAM-dependent methyltransferase/uncharacterized protein YbaR (Trm112 family)
MPKRYFDSSGRPKMVDVLHPIQRIPIMSDLRLNKAYLSLLSCPRCRQGLRIEEDRATCTNSTAHSYPIVAGVPILIDESQSLFSINSFVVGTQGGGRPTGLKAVARKYLPSLSLNVAKRANSDRFLQLILESSIQPIALNIGGKHPEAGLRRILADPRFGLIEIDVSLGPSTEVVGDAGNLPFSDECFDAVIIDAVLEHVPDPYAATKEIHRVLKPHGIVYADSPFMLQVHGGAYDFFRYSPLAHRRLFRQFEEIASGVSTGPGSALAYSMQYFALSFVRRQYARLAIKLLCSVCLFWLKYLDLWLVRKPGALDAALGVYFIGRKSANTLSDRDLLRLYSGSTPNLYERAKLAK